MVMQIKLVVVVVVDGGHHFGKKIFRLHLDKLLQNNLEDNNIPPMKLC